MKTGDVRTNCLSIRDEKEATDVSQSDDELAPCLPSKLPSNLLSILDRGDLQANECTKFRETALDDNTTNEQRIFITMEDETSSLMEKPQQIAIPKHSVIASDEMLNYTSENKRELKDTDDCNATSTKVAVTDACAKDVTPVTDENNTVYQETHDNVKESSVDEFTPLNNVNSCNSSSKIDGIDLPVEVVEQDLNEADLSWQHVLEEHKERRAREAVAALNDHRPHETSSPFGYKSWLLRLTNRRRFEIAITIGLFLWLAFFIILAIFMNGPSSKSAELSKSVTTDRSRASVFQPVGRNQSISINTNQFNGTNLSALRTIVSTTTSQPLNFTEESVLPRMTTSQVKSKQTTSANDRVFSTNPSQKAAVFTSAFSATTSTISTILNIWRAATSSSDRNAEASTNINSTHIPSQISHPERSTFPPPPKHRKITTSFSTVAVADPKTSTDFLHTHAIHSPTLSKENTANLTWRFYEDKRNSHKIQQVLQEMKPNYEIGLGRVDITGPAADVNMMGYANPSQTASGVHTRQYARAFLIADESSRVLFVNIDACMGSTLLKLEVLKRLKSLYGNLYTAENVCISGTHTHSAPAGFLQDVLFQITSMGYVPETLKAMVEGIVQSVQIAHGKLAPGYILLSKGELLESNINRSPIAYLNNPEKERKKYKYDVDKEMVLLKFLDANGRGIGMLNWFAVHCTSMNNTNTLISGDNKGYAEMLFEYEMNPTSLVGEGDFVAAFAQSNEGDVSPNTKGPHCIDTGFPCDNVHSTCNGKVQNCIANGPGKDMFESTAIIAKNQFRKAMELYTSASTFLTGPVQFAHQYIDMTNQTVVFNATHTGRTCKPAMGFSFAAGTTDGPGAFDFKQGDKAGNTFWKAVRNFLHSPSNEQKKCHYPKPILLDTGEMKYPYSWQPKVVDTQIFRVGQLLISAVPGEFTTMSGRRLRDAVLEEFSKHNASEHFESVIAGLANTYSDYIATYEEYHVQRYEGASTIFGPHTLSAYIQQYRKLAISMIEGKPLDGGAKVENLLSNLMSLVPGVVMDSTPFGYDFGDVLKEATQNYTAGDVIKVQFVSGNPRNSPSINMTFLTVERKVKNSTWKVYRTDGDWDTRYVWERSSTLGNVRGLSEATIIWSTSPTTPSGYYRLNHYGHYKYFWNRNIYGYKGTSKVFYIIGKD